MGEEMETGRYIMTKTEMVAFILIIFLQFVSTAVTNMLIPIYEVVTDYYNVDSSLQGIPDSVFIIITAAMSLIWGYYTDRINRSKVIMGGAFIGLVGTTITAFNITQTFFGFQILIFARGLTGVGLGSILPVGLSILADLIPQSERSGWFGMMAILNSVSNGIGQGLSSFLGGLNIFGFGWRFPFFLISIINVIVIILLFFIKIPQRGSHEEELESLQEFEISYMYQLSKRDIKEILKKKTNLLIFLQGFFAIIPGTLVVYFLTTLFSHVDNQGVGLLAGVSEDIRIPVSSILAALVGVGYLVGNSILAGLGDKLFKKDKRNRVLLAGLCLCFSVPFCVIFVFLAGRLSPGHNVIPNDASVLQALYLIFISHPAEFIFYFIFAFVGSFFSAAPVANRGAVMVDVNLPEHRGTTIAFFNLSEQLGKGITLALSWVMLQFFKNTFPSINPYQSMIIFAAFFWLPAGILWLQASKFVKKDMNEKSTILKERTQLTFIDYIFELEIQLDEGIQKIHDANKLLGKDNKGAMNRIEKSIKVFKGIENRATHEEMNDLKSRAHNLMLKAIMLESELKHILLLEKENKESEAKDEIKQLSIKIDDWWDKSDLGKIEVLYDSGYLKLIEARLNRKYNLFKTLKILKESIETFERVEALSRERLIDEEIRKLTNEEKEFQERIKDLINKADQTKINTYNLKESLERLIKQLEEQGISTDDLEKIISLAAEYLVPYTDIFSDAIENRRARRTLENISKEIDELFDKFDREQLIQ